MNIINIDDETRKKLEFAVNMLKDPDDYSFNILNSDTRDAIDILVTFTKSVLEGGKDDSK